MIRQLTIQEDPQTGDLYLDLTEELCDEMGWSIGDDLVWEERADGAWSLRKKDASTVE